MFDEGLFRAEERAVFRLRELYGKYGYLPYKMSKFEEYELYVRNKNFLVNDRVIAFNDTNGKLLALKPDVTLSIIKNSDLSEGEKRKVCYNESVYRVSRGTHRFKEIMQTGLECFGDIDEYDVYEVVSLAAESLASLSDRFVLDISHLGLLSSALERTCADGSFASRAIPFIKEKNEHDLVRLCGEYGVSEEKTQNLLLLVNSYGERKKVLDSLRGIFDGKELDELLSLSQLLESSPLSEKIFIDFSVVNDIDYYNGIVFRGFLDGLCDGVLAGGRYDKLMEQMGKKAGAIGFAIYLDELEWLQKEKSAAGADVLLLYDEGTPSGKVAEKVAEFVGQGKRVSAQKTLPEKLAYREIVDLRGGKEA